MHDLVDFPEFIVVDGKTYELIHTWRSNEWVGEYVYSRKSTREIDGIEVEVKNSETLMVPKKLAEKLAKK